MLSHREIVKRLQVSALVSVIVQIPQVLCHSLWIAGNIDDFFYTVADYLIEGLGLNSHTRRVDHYYIRLIGNFV